MAKVRAPLFSFGASGKIGNALVYFPWKGINAVREYVVPANPRTADQVSHRGHMTAAVSAINQARTFPTNPLGAADVAAYRMWAAQQPSPMTWWNKLCKLFIDQLVAGNGGEVYRGAVLTPGANQIGVLLHGYRLAEADITAGDFWYGTSPSALIHSEAATIDGDPLNANATIAGLADGTRYYIQFRPTAGADYVGANSGIYTAVAGA